MSQEKLDILDKFRIRPQFGGAAEEMEMEEHRAYGVMRVGGRPVVMLDLRFSNGKRRAFGYSYLLDADYDPSQGITLHFAAHSVTLNGSRLDALYDGLVRHAVVYVQERRGTDRVEDAEAVIEKIVIEPRER